MEFKELIKPDYRKIILWLVIILPLLSRIIIEIIRVSKGYIPLPLLFSSNFYLLNSYFSNNLFTIIAYAVGFFIVAPIFSLFGYTVPEGLPPGAYIIFIAISIVFIFLYYLLACLIVRIWRKIFENFGEKSRIYEIIISILIVAIVLIILVILPLIGNTFINIDKNIYQEISGSDISGKPGVLGKITLENSFFITSYYQLPVLSACLYNTQGERKSDYEVTYRFEDGGFISDNLDAVPRMYLGTGIVRIPAKEKVVVNLKLQLKSNDVLDSDEIIILEGTQEHSLKNCPNSNEDLPKTERIKILHNQFLEKDYSK